MNTAEILAIAGSLIYLAGYWYYNNAAIRGEKEPDLVPWMIWGTMSLLNALTYSDIAKDDIAAMLSRTGAVASIVTLVIAILKGGRMKRLNTRDYFVLALGFVSIVAWKMSDAMFANVFVLVAVALGCEPIWRKLAKNPRAQASRPWFLWSLALVINVLVVYLRHKEPVAYVQPVVYAVLHVFTWTMTLRK